MLVMCTDPWMFIQKLAADAWFMTVDLAKRQAG